MTSSGTVTLQVCRMRHRDVAGAVASGRHALHRLRRDPAVTFAKLLGTAGPQFRPSDVRVTRWALLTWWDMPEPADTRWHPPAVESATLRLRPMWSRGGWDGHVPHVAPAQVANPASTVLMLTRSRLRAHLAARFYRAVPAIATELAHRDGLRVAFGIGESPLLRQGTVSIWDSPAAMRRFARDSPAHAAAVRATPSIGWYAEEMFTAFAVTAATGTIDGVDVLP